MIAFLNLWAFALLPLPALIWYFGPVLPAKSAVAVPESVLATLRQMSGARGEDRIGPPADLLLRIVGWAALVLALAGPHQERAPLLSPSGRGRCGGARSVRLDGRDGHEFRRCHAD